MRCTSGLWANAGVTANKTVNRIRMFLPSAVILPAPLFAIDTSHSEFTLALKCQTEPRPEGVALQRPGRQHLPTPVCGVAGHAVSPHLTPIPRNFIKRQGF